MTEVTRILADIDRGTPQAAERLLPLVTLIRSTQCFTCLNGLSPDLQHFG